MTNILDAICNTCSCSAEEAQEHLDNELRHLRELRELESEGLGTLESRDFQYACENLGLESDYQDYFINQLIVA